MTSKKYWDNPEEFNPDRFMNYGKYIVSNNAFTPFGMGTRKCLGEKYALASLFIYFTRFIQKTSDNDCKIRTFNQDYLEPDSKKFAIFSPKKYEMSF